MKRYEDKKVVIIGGTSGMGLATAKMLLDGGARVLVTGRSKEGLESAQKELGNEAIVVSSAARSLTDLDALASRVKAEFDTVGYPPYHRRSPLPRWFHPHPARPGSRN
jgi:NAD(P)-dependent dehydrogenase (short-subunit alcohol dehydrogenase family)